MSYTLTWKKLETLDQLTKVIDDSRVKPALVFKHRASAEESAQVKETLENDWSIPADQLECYLVDVMQDKAVASEVSELAESWKEMMPPDGQEYFKISAVTEDTAYTEIHLHCPLRATGNVKACYKLMNYDHSLMKAIGGQLIVLESQSNSGKGYCRLAIRKADQPVDDLIPAHQQIMK